jgi:sigma-B regulation protein RsbU (phosphoserine phosphatase)
MFWSYFDPQTRCLSFVNAGHCPPLLVRRSQRTPALRLLTGGPVLGLIREAQFEQGSVRLQSGDRLILYSDGVVEATDAAGDEFGEERLMAVVRAHGQETAEALRGAILRAIDAFAGTTTQQDDRSLLVAVYVEAERERISKDSESRAAWSPFVTQPAALTPIGG